MPGLGSEQSTCKKPQNISPPISCLCTDCNSLCGLEAEPKREAVISKQHNMREVWRASLLCPLSCRRVKRLPCHYEIAAGFSTSVAKTTTLWSGTASLLYHEQKRRKIWSTEGTNHRAKGFLFSQGSSKTKRQGTMKTFHTKIWERRGQACVSARRKPRWREAEQPVSSRPLLSEELRKWVSFRVLPHCWRVQVAPH